MAQENNTEMKENIVGNEITDNIEVQNNEISKELNQVQPEILEERGILEDSKESKLIMDENGVIDDHNEDEQIKQSPENNVQDFSKPEDQVN